MWEQPLATDQTALLGLQRWRRCPIRKRHSLFLFLYQFIILSFCVLFSFIFFKINFYLFKVPLNVYLFPCLPLPLKLHFCHTLHKINLVLFLFQGRIKPVMPWWLCRPFRISWCFNYYFLCFIFYFLICVVSNDLAQHFKLFSTICTFKW